MENKEAMKAAKLWEVLVAGAIGAFLVSVFDIFKNQSESTIAELSKKVDFLGDGLSLLFLVLFAVGMCWVFRPYTKRDAFARGLAILSLFNVMANNELPDKGLDVSQIEDISPHNSMEGQLVASLHWTDYRSPYLAPCPEGSGSFKPNAVVVNNEWISSTEPKSSWYKSSISTTKCDNTLNKGQQIQLINYHETTFGYYYVEVNYLDALQTLHAGWIYSGRSPRHFQSITPNDPKLDPYGFGK